MKAGLVLAGVAASVALIGGASSSRADTTAAQMRICNEFASPPVVNVQFGITIMPATSGAPDQLGPGCSLVFPLPSGAYSLTETQASGVLLVGATCTRSNGATFLGPTGTLEDNTIVGIEAQPGDLVGCTFVYIAAPTTKEQCKNGGWQSFGLATDSFGLPAGSVFGNQGDCVSYVATGGKISGDGTAV